MKYALIPMLLLACCVAGVAHVSNVNAAEETKAAAPRYADIDHKDLVKLIAEKKVFLIDCNGSETFKTGHIPGAVDFEAKSADLAKLLPADKGALVVAYCGSVYCPAYKSGADAAAKLGYTNVKHYPGGLAGWQESGEKLEK